MRGAIRQFQFSSFVRKSSSSILWISLPKSVVVGNFFSEFHFKNKILFLSGRINDKTVTCGGKILVELLARIFF